MYLKLCVPFPKYLKVFNCCILVLPYNAFCYNSYPTIAKSRFWISPLYLSAIQLSYCAWNIPRLIERERPCVLVIVWRTWTLCFVKTPWVALVFLIILHLCQNAGQGMDFGGIIALPEPLHKDDERSWFRRFEVWAATKIGMTLGSFRDFQRS